MAGKRKQISCLSMLFPVIYLLVTPIDNYLACCCHCIVLLVIIFYSRLLRDLPSEEFGGVVNNLNKKLRILDAHMACKDTFHLIQNNVLQVDKVRAVLFVIFHTTSVILVVLITSYSCIMHYFLKFLL